MGKGTIQAEARRTAGITTFQSTVNKCRVMKFDIIQPKRGNEIPAWIGWAKPP